MKPLFTIHAGEYILGSFIEAKFRNLTLWVPTKDTGIDFLVTDKNNNKSITFQVKFSRDFLATHMSDIFQSGLEACGWWTLNRDKIRKSKADYWVFVLHAFKEKAYNYIVITPSELLEKLTRLHGTSKTVQTYFWITKQRKCWETRGLKKTDQILIANNAFRNDERDFTAYLNAWAELTKLNAKK